MLLEAETRKSAPAQILRAQRGREVASLDPHSDRLDIGDAASAQSVGELPVRADDRIEHLPETSEVPPKPAEAAIDRSLRCDATKPTVSVSSERVGVHHERSRGCTLPATNHRRARPRRRCLDVIGLPGIESCVEQLLVIEITIAPVDRQSRRWDRDQESARPVPRHFMAFARRDNDHLMAEAGGSAKLRPSISSNTASKGRVEGANIDDPH